MTCTCIVFATDTKRDQPIFNMQAMNISVGSQPCLDSTLSLELASFKLSSTLHGFLLAICVTNGLLSVLATLGNSLVIIIILKFPSLRTLSNILIFSLALIDVLVGVIVQPAFVVYIAGKINLEFYCGALLSYLYTEIFCVGMSLITLSLIACERFFAIVYPFKYINYMTKPRLITIVATVWAVWFLFNIICRALRVKNDEFFSPIASAIIGFSLILNISLYFKIFKIIRRHERQINAQQKVSIAIRARDSRNDDNDSSSPQESTGLSSRETHMARTVAYITGVLVLCYLLLMVTSFADMLMEDDALFDHLLYPLAETITFLNSSLNPFLYCWRCRDLREKMWLVLKGSKYSPSNIFNSRRSAEHKQSTERETSTRRQEHV